MSTAQAPFRESGATRYGAQFGRPERGEPHGHYVKLRVRMVKLDEGYDPGGAYWGDRPKGVMLFCIWAPRTKHIVRYRDATSYLFTEQSVMREFPHADFIEG